MKKKAIVSVLVTGILIAALSACGNAPANTQTSEGTTIAPEIPAESLTEEETSSPSYYDGAFADKGLTDPCYQALMSQTAEKGIDLSYSDYLPDERFAQAKIFGVEEDGKEAKAYVHLSTAEYVVLEGNSYLMSAATGEAILHYTSTDDSVSLDKIEWSEDGTGHEEWVRKKFPKDALAKRDAFIKEEGLQALNAYVDSQAAESLGAPVNKEDILTIDLDKETYEILSVEESGDPAGDDYTFDTKVISSGKLSKR